MFHTFKVDSVLFLNFQRLRYRLSVRKIDKNFQRLRKGCVSEIGVSLLLIMLLGYHVAIRVRRLYYVSISINYRRSEMRSETHMCCVRQSCINRVTRSRQQWRCHRLEDTFLVVRNTCRKFVYKLFDLCRDCWAHTMFYDRTIATNTRFVKCRPIVCSRKRCLWRSMILKSSCFSSESLHTTLYVCRRLASPSIGRLMKFVATPLPG